MWRKTLGLGLLALMLFALSGCAARYQSHGYRDGHSRGYVQVRVGSGYGHGRFVRGHAYRYRHYRNPGGYYHHRHFRGCGHRW
jgi:hypothetical protein